MIILFAPEYRKNSIILDYINKIALKFNHGFEVIYIKKEVNPLQQQQFLYAVHIADIVIVDSTIPEDGSDGGVYPALTAQINSLNHVIVISENNLPLNITPYRGVFPKKDGERFSIEQIISLLPKAIEESLKHDKYDRLPKDIYKDFAAHQEEMIKMLKESLAIREDNQSKRTRVMVSYRNSHNKEVKEFAGIIEANDENSESTRTAMGIPEGYELKVLPPASLCGEYEAHTPMRRWMLVGLLEDHIRGVDEVWIYESRDSKGDIDYTNSWWTIAEMIMVANLNFDREEEKKIKVRVYNPEENQFHDTTEAKYSHYSIKITQEQHRRLTRLLSNTRPDTMGPESIENIERLKGFAEILRSSSDEMKEAMQQQLRYNIEQNTPQGMFDDNREKAIDDLVKLYSDPDEIERYASDDVFKDEFWEKISYQTSSRTKCFVGDRIDVDGFLNTPMDEVLNLSIKDFADNTDKLNSILSPADYSVKKADTDRYLWMATRMGKPTVKDGNAPGLERIPIYNIRKIR